MEIIYQPKGRALEYAARAANLYRGCSHGCEYCFAPRTTRKDKDLFHSEEFIRPRKDVLKHLIVDAKKYAGCPHNVLLSFTSDPYQPIEEDLKITREAIKILNGENIGVTILTKGGALAERDFDILKLNPANQFGVTLTCVNSVASEEWEPGAAMPFERVNSLRIAQAQGIYTYVSLEPVLDPERVYELICATHKFVNFYKIGKLNYHPHAKTIDWVKFRENVKALLLNYGKDFMLKKDLTAAGL